MHPLTPAILESWNRLLPTLLKNPDELNKRLARRRATTFSRPPRPWCLAIRATDSRTDAFAETTLPLHPSLLRRRPSLIIPHHVTITADLLLHLNRPIDPELTGEDADDLAKLLGTRPNALRLARYRNLLRAHHVPHLSGKPGRPIPILYASNPLHPNLPLRQPPDPLWGTIYPSPHARPLLPADFQQQVERIPAPHRPRAASPHHPTPPSPPRRFHLPPPPPDYVWYKWKDGLPCGAGVPPASSGPHRKRRPQRSPNPKSAIRNPQSNLPYHHWLFLCLSCKKPVTTLYYPLFAVHALNLLATPHRPFVPSPHSPTPPSPHPSLRDADGPDAYLPPPQTLACHTCHRIRNVSPVERDGWNLLISHLTAGLLYGHEVPKPKEFQPTRTRPYRPRAHRPAPQRSRVLRRLLNGWPIPKIALDLQISRRAVHHHVKLLCHQENVPDRHALAQKFHSPHAPHSSFIVPHSSLSFIQQRRSTIQSLLLAGLTRRQIMRQLHLPAHIVHYDTNRIYKHHNVHSAAELVDKVNV